MKTKTCKTCNETKDIIAFNKRSGHCRPCLNNINRKLYFLKKGITLLPEKTKKYNSSEERNVMKLIYHRNRDNYNSQTLSDEYIKDQIRLKAYYHKILPDLSEENIIITRERIKQIRLVKTGGKKECKKCKNILEKTYFLKTGSSLCKKCYYKKNYVIYGRKPYTYEKGQIAKKKYHDNKEKLTESYVKKTIISSLKNYKLGIVRSDISNNYVKLKRKELLTKRKIESWQKQQQK